MEFANPEYLWLLLLVPLSLALGFKTERFAARVRWIFAGQQTALHQWRSKGRIATAALALLCLVLAMSGMQVWALLPGDIRQGLVLAVGLDVSKSMLAEDFNGGKSNGETNIQASRLNAGSQLAVQLFEELGSEKAALFLFARNGIEVVTPTQDKGFLRYMAQHTNLAQLTESGSNLAIAMQTGADLITAGNDPSRGAIVLISDGEDTENQLTDLISEVETLKARRIPVFTVGVGHEKNVFIPIRRTGVPGVQDFYQDKQGNFLKTRLEDRPLREIATATGGHYWHIENISDNNPGRVLLDQIANSLKSQAEKVPKEKRRMDLSPFFLGFGLVFYLGYLVL